MYKRATMSKPPTPTSPSLPPSLPLSLPPSLLPLQQITSGAARDVDQGAVMSDANAAFAYSTAEERRAASEPLGGREGGKGGGEGREGRHGRGGREGGI